MKTLIKTKVNNFYTPKCPVGHFGVVNQKFM